MPHQYQSIEARCAQIAAEHGLTPRETEVFTLLARGRDVGFICAELYISRNTANAHRRAIYSKLAATPGRGSSTSWRTAWEGSSARGRAAGRAQGCGRPRQGAQGPRAGNRPGLPEGPPKHTPLR